MVGCFVAKETANPFGGCHRASVALGGMCTHGGAGNAAGKVSCAHEGVSRISSAFLRFLGARGAVPCSPGAWLRGVCGTSLASIVITAVEKRGEGLSAQNTSRCQTFSYLLAHRSPRSGEFVLKHKEWRGEREEMETGKGRPRALRSGGQTPLCRR